MDSNPVTEPDQIEGAETKAIDDAQFKELVQKSTDAERMIRGGVKANQVAKTLDLPLSIVKDLQASIRSDRRGLSAKRSFTTSSLSDSKRRAKRKSQRRARRVTRSK